MSKTRTIAALGLCVVAGWTARAHADAVTEWNGLAVACINRAGPTALLDIALTQAAVHNAIQAIEKRYEPYISAPAANGDESKAAAAAAAARRMLSRVCPDTAQAGLDVAFAPYLAGEDPGLGVGYAAADAMIAEIRGTTTTIPEPYIGNTEIGQWRSTPPANAPMSFVYLATTQPFVLRSPSQFRPGPPPPVGSPLYRKEYSEVKEMGAVESHPEAGACPAPRTTDMARFWAGNFVAQWNETARHIALDRQLKIGDTARLLALANLAAADSAIAVWDSKVHYNWWRPITAIREDDGDPKTQQDPAWTPFIESGHFAGTPTQSQTPPYPDYVSGANGLVGAFVTTLQLYFRTDHMPFVVYKASPPTVPVCQNPRTYRRLSDAAEEVVDARIYLGLHFRSADTAARRLGSRVAFWTFTKALRPVGWPD